MFSASCSELQVDASADVAAAVDSCSSQVVELLSKAEATLRSVCEKMFPDDLSPATISWLLNWFADEDDPVEEFRQAQTKAGAAGALSLLLAHGVDVDLEKVTSDLPRDGQGHLVDMTSFAEAADAPADRVVELLVKQVVAASEPESVE